MWWWKRMVKKSDKKVKITVAHKSIIVQTMILLYGNQSTKLPKRHVDEAGYP